MKLTLKLYASLSEHLPPDAKHNTAQIEVPEDVTLDWLIEHFRVPEEMAHLVLVNGAFICAQDRRNPQLNEGDTVAIWPPVAGG